MHEALEPTQDTGWVLSHEGYNVLTESSIEPRFACGKGFCQGPFQQQAVRLVEHQEGSRIPRLGEGASDLVLGAAHKGVEQIGRALLRHRQPHPPGQMPYPCTLAGPRRSGKQERNGARCVGAQQVGLQRGKIAVGVHQRRIVAGVEFGLGRRQAAWPEAPSRRPLVRSAPANPTAC
jgi:hypothetical protein